MIGMKSLIVAAVLLASVVEAKYREDSLIASICELMAKSLDGQSITDSHVAWSKVESWSRGGQQYFIRDDCTSILGHWDAMLKGKQPGSLRTMAVMSWCKPPFPKAIIADPLKAFTDKYLNSELVFEHVRGMSAEMHSEVKRDLIDAQFIDDFRKSNPEAGPLNFNNKTLDGAKAVGAIAEAFKRHLAKTGQDVKALIESDSLREIIYEKLTRDCLKNFENGIYYAKEMEKVSELWEGGLEAMIATLTPEAQRVIFRYGFCANIYEKSVQQRRALQSEVLAKLQ